MIEDGSVAHRSAALHATAASSLCLFRRSMTLRQRIGLGVMQNMSGMQIKQDLTVFVPVQALSVTLRQRTLDSALRNVGKLKAAVDKCKATDAQRAAQRVRPAPGRTAGKWLCCSLGVCGTSLSHVSALLRT